jgi:hypothetical protein
LDALRRLLFFDRRDVDEIVAALAFADHATSAGVPAAPGLSIACRGQIDRNDQSACGGVPGAPTLKNDVQAEYDARVTVEHAPTQKEDRAWAETKGIPRDRVRELRRANKDPRLHKKGPRREGSD